MNNNFSDDELEEFEYSEDDAKQHFTKNQKILSDKPYDEAYDVSQDLSVAESFDGRDKQMPAERKERQVKNDIYDEAFDVSQSLEQSYQQPTPNISNAISNGNNSSKMSDKVSSGPSGKLVTADSARSQLLINSHMDEAYDMSESSSENSIDTQYGRDRAKKESKATTSNPELEPRATNAHLQSMPKNAPKLQESVINDDKNDSPSKLDESSDGEHEASYDNLEGAYNPKEFARLNVPNEVKDLFQYIERYNPHEVEIDTYLKCFIPEYIPSIGEIDSFIKIPRPDDKDDDFGIKVLDEPATVQSDPTVLELQLRAISKKLQYNEMAVRSIENAAKNPTAIEKWIQSVNDLHRTKPPPHVTYKKNMPDIEKLMEAWPDDFAQVLRSNPLPSPDLDVSLLEYVKVVCSLLDIPVYDNPIESLHLMFSLLMDFKNNPHFQARLADSINSDGSNDRAESKNEFTMDYLDGK